MDDGKLRAWWWHRQGLDGSLRGKKPAETLTRSGWARSVGGVGPYLSLFARARTPRAAADTAVAKLQIHELPATRGCTYVLPASDFALGLSLARAFGEAELNTAAKLGVARKEVDALCKAVAAALGDEPLDPDAIKQIVGNAVRNLGEEGKKKGMVTTLPLALGILQASGEIRRVPVGGRLDQQRYRYARWSPNPLAKTPLSSNDAFTELARRFFGWVGPATMKEFQWVSALGVKAAKEAVAPLGLRPAAPDSDRFLLPDDVAAFEALAPGRAPEYALVSSLDAIAAARRDVATLTDPRDRETVERLTLGERPGSSRDEIGDARSFSLDSPKSRRPKLEALARN